MIQKKKSYGIIHSHGTELNAIRSTLSMVYIGEFNTADSVSGYYFNLQLSLLLHTYIYEVVPFVTNLGEFLLQYRIWHSFKLLATATKIENFLFFVARQSVEVANVSAALI